MRNKAGATSSGFDMVADVTLRDDWSMMFGYSYIDINAKFDVDANDFDPELGQGASPHHQIKIKSNYNITRNIDFDAAFYYVGSLNIRFAPQPSFIESYTRLDLRLAWRPRDDVELSLVGQRLFYGATREMTRMFYQTQNAVYGNAVYGQVRWGF
jgi:iron complex outermembrane receptor protein